MYVDSRYLLSVGRSSYGHFVHTPISVFWFRFRAY
eukprot:SAG31_NODE_25711_length_456_cov_0.700280_1_plen_34_part_10